MVNARSIQSVSTGMYVTADPNGAQPLAAARTSPSAYEAFTVVTAADGTITIKALVNNQFIVNVNGGAVNKASGGTPLQLKLVSPPAPSGSPIPASGVITNVGTNATISVNKGNANLRLSVTGETALTFNFATLTNGKSGYSISSTQNKMYVTGDISGKYPLSAGRTAVSGWEQFTIVGISTCQFVILAQNNNAFWAVNADGQLYPNGNAINGTTLFNLGGPSYIFHHSAHLY